MESLDQKIFLLLNAGDDASHGVVVVAKILAEWPVALAIVMALWALWRQKDGLFLWRTLAITGLAMFTSYMIRTVWPQPRPFVVGIGNTLAFHEATPSFPSLHATFLFALGFAVLLNKCCLRVAVIMLLLAFCTAWSRIYIGVHFPEDMAAAFMVALGVTLFIAVAITRNPKLFNHRK